MKLNVPSRMTAHVAQLVLAGHPEIEKTIISNQLRKKWLKYHLVYVKLRNYGFQVSTKGP